MTFVIQKELKDILSVQEEIKLSLYMPVVGPGKGDEENKIRFKNLLQKAESSLLESGVKTSDLPLYLHSAKKILDDNAFFRNQEKGFALFISREITKYFFLPYEASESFTFGKQFFITPLLPSFYGDGQFFILGLTKDNARLFSGSKQAIFEVDISDAVTEATKQMDLIQIEKSLNHHSVSPAGGGPGAIFHGKDGSELEKELLRQFFRLIDDGISSIVNKHRYPLVLCGVDYLLPIYREITKYSSLIKEGIHGNPDDMETKLLHQKSWAIVEDLFLENLTQDLESYHQRKGSGGTSSDITEIAEKASYGQVASLFITLESKHQGNDSDPLNLSVINTITHNGQVYGVAADALGEGITTAALLRY